MTVVTERAGQIGRPQRMPSHLLSGLVGLLTALTVVIVFDQFNMSMSFALQLASVTLLAALAVAAIGFATFRAARRRANLARELNETSARLHELQIRAQVLERSRLDLIAWVSADLHDVVTRVEEALQGIEGIESAELRQEIAKMRGIVGDLLELNSSGVSDSATHDHDRSSTA